MGISPVPLGLYGDETITACAWISGITGLGFVVRSLTFARPVIDLRALAIRNFSLGWWVSFVTGIGIFTTVYLTPRCQCSSGVANDGVTIASFVMHPLQAWASVRHRSASIDKRAYAPN